MLIVAGTFEVDAADQDAFVTARVAAMADTRTEGGCLEYVMSADPVDATRVMLFERWEIARSSTGPRVVHASPGVSVGTLIARGEVELGFQQLRELMHLVNVEVIGPMPPGLEIVTTFACVVCTTSLQPEAVRALLDFIRSPVADAAKWRHGMQPT